MRLEQIFCTRAKDFRGKGTKGMKGALRGSQSAGMWFSSEPEWTNISPRTLLAEAKGEP